MVKTPITYITNPEYFGYYDSAGQEEPAFDPGENTPCLICEKPWDMEDVRTISFVALKKSTKLELQNVCYFYRVHKSCHNALSEDEKSDFEGRIVESTESN